jgi:hypothetical protein
MKAAMVICLLLAASLWTNAARADCQCRANGRIFHHGEITCLRMPNGPQLARCGMAQNNSSWIKLQDGCPTASLMKDDMAASAAPVLRLGQPALCQRS